MYRFLQIFSLMKDRMFYLTWLLSLVIFLLGGGHCDHLLTFVYFKLLSNTDLPSQGYYDSVHH